MLNSNSEIRIYGLILVVMIVVLSVTTFLLRNVQNMEGKQSVNVYFLNPTLHTLEKEEHYLNIGNNDEMILELLSILYAGPNNKNLAKTMPEDLKLEKGQLIENKSLLELSFTFDGETLGSEEELFFKSAIIWTMTELSSVKDLHIFINNHELLRSDGEPLGLLNRSNVVINKHISPFVSDIQRVVLYFANESSTALVPEERVIQMMKTNPDQVIEKFIVEQLIAGPNKAENHATIPPETKVREVSTEGNICYVNLSSDIVNKYAGTSTDIRLPIYSIVNSLTELTDIKKVQFLIDSKKPEGLKSGFDLSKPLERDEEIMKK